MSMLTSVRRAWLAVTSRATSRAPQPARGHAREHMEVCGGDFVFVYVCVCVCARERGWGATRG